MDTTQTEAQVITLEDVTNILHRLTSAQAEGVALLLSSKAPPEHTISSNVHFIVGLTSDGHVLYAGPERVPSYCVEPYDNVHRSLQKSIDEGRVELEGQEENPMFRGSPQRTAIEAHGIDQFVSRGIYGRLKHKEATLAHLEHLKTDYDARQAKEARRV